MQTVMFAFFVAAYSIHYSVYSSFHAIHSDPVADGSTTINRLPDTIKQNWPEILYYTDA
jgi:hypothetical protein